MSKPQHTVQCKTPREGRFAFCQSAWRELPHQVGFAQHSHRSLHVPDQDGDGHFRSCAVQSPEQEPRVFENPVFQGRKRVLDRAAPSAHRLGRGPDMHALQCFFMEMARHMPMAALRATRFQRACTAVRRVGSIDDHLLLAVELLALKGSTCRAGEAVVVWIVGKGRPVELRSITLIVDAAVGGHMRHDALGLQCRRLCPIGVAGIGQYIQPLHAQGVPCRLGHRLQTAVVARIGMHLMRHAPQLQQRQSGDESFDDTADVIRRVSVHPAPAGTSCFADDLHHGQSP